MLRIDLSALSRAELRRLLAAARARGQTGLTDQLQAELAARAAGKGASDAVSRLLPPAFDEDETEPMKAPAGLPELSVAAPGRRPRSASRGPLAFAILGILAAVGGAAWGLNGAPGWPGPRPAPGPATRPAAAIAAAAPAAGAPRAMVARVEPVPPAAAGVAPPPIRAAAPSPPPERPAPRRLDPCAAPPTPADRLLCNDLGLNLLDHEMRDAYGRAMAAGADPVALRDSQAAWRRARDPTGDPRALAQLYGRRIRELKAQASADASQEAEPER